MLIHEWYATTDAGLAYLEDAKLSGVCSSTQFTTLNRATQLVDIPSLTCDS